MGTTRQITESFRLLRVLKASPQTTVFQASDPQTGHEVVIKLLSPPGAIASPASQERFTRFMETLQGVGIEGLPHILDHGFQPDSSAFVVMEPATGCGLDTLAGTRPTRILPILARVARALQAMTSDGLTHHNLSPDNIQVTSGDAACLMGIGSAAFLAEADGSGMLGHSPEFDRYAAPELLDPQAERPPQRWVSDLYSLALIACELLDAPITDLGTDQPKVAIPQRNRIQLATFEELERVLAAALRFNPAARGVGYGELLAAMQAAMPASGEVAEAPPEGATVHMPLGVMPIPGAPPPPPPQPSEEEDEAPTGRFDTIKMDPVIHPSAAPPPPPAEPEGGATMMMAIPAMAPPETRTEAVPPEPPAEGGATVIAPIPIPRPPAPAPAEDEGATTMLPTPSVEGPGPEPKPEADAPPPEPPPDGGATVMARIPIPPPPVPEPEPVQAAAEPPAEEGTVMMPSPTAVRPEPVAAPLPEVEAPHPEPPADAGATVMAAIPIPPAPQPKPAPVPAPPAPAAPAPPPKPVPPAPPAVPKAAPPPPAVPKGPPSPPPAAPAPPKPPAAAAEPAPPAAPTPMPHPEVERRPPPKPGKRPPWALIAGGGAAFVLLVAVIVGVAVMMGGPGEQPAPTPAPTAVPTAVPTPAVLAPQMNPKLLAAESSLAGGDVDTARQLIASVTPDEVILFNNEETALYEQLQQEVQGMSREAALKDLDTGLQQGSITRLRRAIRTLGDMSSREISEVSGLKDKLATAREAVRVYSLAKRAVDDGNHAEALAQSGQVLSILPKNGDAQKWRAAAAAALEAEADAAMGAGNWDLASERLQTVQRAWPDRPGIADKIRRAEQQSAGEQRQQEMLDTAIARGKAGDPEGALDQLNRAQPSGRFTKLYADARAQLQKQLEQLDAQPPVIAVSNPDQIEYKKKEAAKIHIRVSDDYKVVGVKAMVRTEAVRTYREMTLKKTSADQYLLEVGPDLHGGGDIELYVEATDPSGHVGRLGSADKPKTVDRKKGLLP